MNRLSDDIANLEGALSRLFFFFRGTSIDASTKQFIGILQTDVDPNMVIELLGEIDLFRFQIFSDVDGNTSYA